MNLAVTAQMQHVKPMEDGGLGDGYALLPDTLTLILGVSSAILGNLELRARGCCKRLSKCEGLACCTFVYGRGSRIDVASYVFVSISDGGRRKARSPAIRTTFSFGEAR